MGKDYTINKDGTLIFHRTVTPEVRAIAEALARVTATRATGTAVTGQVSLVRESADLVSERETATEV